MIRTARPSDLDPIERAVSALVTVMNAAGNDQWGPGYPVRADFQRDLDEGALFVDDQEGAVRGFVALNFSEPTGYATLPWSVASPALVVHRLAVVPAFQRRGVADGLFAFAEGRARTLGVGLKSDTAEVNRAMEALFIRRGWRAVGSLRFDDASVGFVGWEKSGFGGPAA